ncbi:MAG: prepilin-type N-terminal cleavage/methylation domain-containing protein [Candidatus Sumerlaeia bacterium]|nr:prepilin-type N-terminal cleavage/methylation domain-containing protein [Candidatus Sumerlaeia bacterium]
MTRAFTLIELLIVVAIIAILAAIAVPNFLEAQTRAKVSRVKSDHRTLATAIEAYAVDNNSYPFDQDNNPYHPVERGFHMLTTPVAYVTALFRDPFSPPVNPGFPDAMDIAAFYYLCSGADNFREGLPNARAFALVSNGPDQRDSSQDTDRFPNGGTNFDAYDPTNGTVSRGDVLRFGGNYLSGNWTLNMVPHGRWGLGEVVPR